jgi:alanine racemase
MIRDELTTQAWMEVDLGALRGNFREIQRRVGTGRKIIAVIKADAYGHGAVEVARALSGLGVHSLATGSFTDALAVRQAGMAIPILLLGNPPPDAIPEILSHDLTPSLDSFETAQAVSEAAGNHTSSVFVKVDAGFGRFGVLLEKAPAFVRRVAELPGIAVEGIYTHLPFSDARGRDWAQSRVAAFEGLVASLAAGGWRIPLSQAVASPGIACGLTDNCGAVACGSLLYGLAPVAPGIGDMSGFRPLVRAIGTRLLHVTDRHGNRNREADAEYLRHGVGATGTVPLGMSTGYRTPAPGRTAFMLLRGRRVPVLRVCLENTILDISAIEDPRPGEEVLALGRAGNEEITLEEMAEWGAVSSLGLLTSFDGRLSRRYPDS